MFLPRRRELKPVEAMPGQGQQVRKFPNGTEGDPAHALHGSDAHEPAQGKLYWLWKTRQIVDTEYPICCIVFGEGPVFARESLRRNGPGGVVLADERQHARVAAGQFLVSAEAEDGVPLPDLDHPPGPVQQRLRVPLLRLDAER